MTTKKPQPKGCECELSGGTVVGLLIGALIFMGIGGCTVNAWQGEDKWERKYQEMRLESEIYRLQRELQGCLSKQLTYQVPKCLSLDKDGNLEDVPCQSGGSI